MAINIGKSSAGAVTLDVGRLLESRILITATSGGGKSWLLRKILEELSGTTQTIVIDPEGEFASLRELRDMLLVGTDGEIPADPRSAGLLARRLLELRISSVIDLYELPPAQRRLWVANFCNSLVNLPKSLWHPCFIAIDEAHEFAAEGEKSDSGQAVTLLQSKGRKRGYAALLATQRLSKLSKDVAAEAKNRFVGQTTLDTDQQRSADFLGFAKSRWPELRDLSPPGREGEWFAVGPALSERGVIKFRSGMVRTTHPKPGEGRKIEPPQASKKIVAVLDGLKDLPQQADEEAKSMADAKRQVSDLRRQLAAKPIPAADDKAIERARAAGKAESARESAAAIKERDRIIGLLKNKMNKAERHIADGLGWLNVNGEATPKSPSAAVVPQVKSPQNPAVQQRIPEKRSFDSRLDAGYRKRIAGTIDQGDLPLGEAKVLAALIQFPDGLRREQITVLTGYKRSTRDAYLYRLSERGYVDAARGDLVVATAEGRAALPDAEPLPTGQELQDYWLARLPEGEQAVLAILIEAYPQAVERASLDDQTGFKRSTRDAYLYRLASKQLVTEPARGEVKASENLFV